MTPFDQLNNQNQDHPNAEEKIHNPTQNPNIYNVINTQLSSRGLLKGLAIGGFLGTIGSSMASKFSLAASPTGQSTLTFAPVSHGIDDTHHVAEGYNADILIRWGDAMFNNAADLKTDSQTAASQQKQFGYNCDFIT